MPGRMRIPPLSEMPRLNLGGEFSSVVQKSDDQVPPQSTKERTGESGEREMSEICDQIERDMDENNVELKGCAVLETPENHQER